MNFKLNSLVAALALLASAPALAAINSGLPALDTLSTGNGDLMLNLKWIESPLVGTNDSASAAFDLGIKMNDMVAFNGVANFTRSWDLSTGMMSGTGLVAPQQIGTYGSAMGNFLATNSLVLTKAEMNVIAFDGTGTAPGDTRLLSTANLINATGSALTLSSSQITANGGFNNIFGNGTVTNFVNGVNNSAGQLGVATGASNATAASGVAYFGTGMDKFGGTTAFDSTGLFGGSYAAGAGMLASQAKALPFYLTVASSNEPTEKTVMTPFGFDLDGDGVIEFDNNTVDAGGFNEFGLWTLQGTTLTFSNPTVAAVPEAETYAMMLAGLGLVGFMVRRRRAI